MCLVVTSRARSILVACSKCEWKAAFQRADLQWNVGIHRCAYRRKPAAYIAVEAKNRAWKGGPYESRVLVIRTDEYVLDRDTVSHFLKVRHVHYRCVPWIVLSL